MAIEIHYQRPWMYPKQSAALFCDARYSVIEASTKSGKTVGALAWLFERALLGKPRQNRWWVAPVYPQAEIAYRRLKQNLSKEIAGLCVFNDTNLRARLPHGGAIWFKSGEKPDTLYGEDVHDVVIDEASRLREEAWHAVRSTITATQGRARIIGNVKGRKNWFFRLARKAEAGEPEMEYHKIIAADAVAAGIIRAEEVEQAKRDLPEQVFRELYLAEPSDDGGNPFGLAAIEKCIAPLSNLKPVVRGIDLAKSVDWTVDIGLDPTGIVSHFDRFQLPWRETMGRLITGPECECLVDSTGVGDAVVEELQRFSRRFQPFKFTSTSKQQLLEGLAVAIQSRKVLFPEGPLQNELESFEYEYTRSGVRYSAPEGLHDDCVIALALAWRAYCSTSHSRLPVVEAEIRLPSYAHVEGGWMV